MVSYLKGEPQDSEKDNEDCCAAENGEGDLVYESANHDGRLIGME
jgi:hypothetical protein